MRPLAGGRLRRVVRRRRGLAWASYDGRGVGVPRVRRMAVVWEGVVDVRLKAIGARETSREKAEGNGGFGELGEMG